MPIQQLPPQCFSSKASRQTLRHWKFLLPVVLFHPSAEGTSHTLPYKPSFSLIMGPMAQKLRPYTC